MLARIARPLGLASALLAAACAPDALTGAPEELPNAAKADRAELAFALTDERPRSFYLMCETEQSCDISVSAQLRAPDLCELASDAGACGPGAAGGLQLPVATVAIETPEGEVHELAVIAARDESGGVRTIVEGGDFLAQAPGAYFLDVRRAPGLERDIELVLRAAYGPEIGPDPEPACDLGGPPEHLGAATTGDRHWVALRWTSGGASWFDREGAGFTVPDTSLLARYRDQVEGAGIDVDPIALLLRQRELYERVAPSHVPTFDAIIDGSLGEIGSIECWEAAVMEDHLRRHLEQRVPNEFQAFLLTQGEGEEARARIYAISGNSTAAPPAGPLLDAVEADVAEGWQMRAHFHNHFFFLAHLPEGDIAGTLIPSPPDRNMYVNNAERFDLAQARITNAFDSVRFRQTEFDELVRLLEPH